MARKKGNGSTAGDAPGPGDNAKAEPTEGMIAAAAAEIMEQQSVVASEAANLGAIYNRHEAQGIDRHAIKATVAKLRKTQDQVATETRRQIKYDIAAGAIALADAKWAQAVHQGGFDLRPATGEAAEQVRFQQAKLQGIQAGKKGHALDGNPYRGKPGSVEFVGWRDGHGEGVVLRARLKPGSENVVHASTEKKKRGRPSNADKAAAAAAEGGQGSDTPPAAGEDAETIASNVAAEIADGDPAPAVH